MKCLRPANDARARFDGGKYFFTANLTIKYHWASNGRSCVYTSRADDVGDNVIGILFVFPKRCLPRPPPVWYRREFRWIFYTVSADYGINIRGFRALRSSGRITNKYAGSRFSGAGDRPDNAGGQTRSTRLRARRNPKTRTVLRGRNIRPGFIEGVRVISRRTRREFLFCRTNVEMDCVNARTRVVDVCFAEPTLRYQFSSLIDFFLLFALLLI